MEGGDIGCKEDDEDRKLIAQSKHDRPSGTLTDNGAQNPKKKDEEDDNDSVLLKDTAFQNFYESFLKDSTTPPSGLKLAITSQLLDRVNTALSVEHDNNHSAPANVNCASTSRSYSAPQLPPEKLKATNFQAKALLIGSWRRVAEVPNDLVVKIYFAKRKLIWEIMEDGLKNKIEIEWADILALRAYSEDDGTEVLQVELCQPPQFFREQKSNPRSHTQWRATGDFTNGQALFCRRHKVICAPGALFKEVARLLQYDSHLNKLKDRNFPSLDSLYFDSRPPVIHSNNQFQPIFKAEVLNSPSDQAQRSSIIYGKLSIQQTTTLQSQVPDGCMNIPAGENSGLVYLSGGMSNFPDSSQLDNSFGDVQFRNIYADAVHEMNNFGNNNQVMNPATSFESYNLAAYYSPQGAEGPSFSGYDYEPLDLLLARYRKDFS
ncbi:hypothetical protein SLE2022_125460 [Rubroshorea leprosula]